MNRLIQFLRRSQRGQSLVEVALVTPILVLLIAGVAEVSNLVVTQNRVSTAARAAARFGASGGEDAGMLLTAINAVTQTLEVAEDRWDIWTIRGEVDSSGTAFDSFTAVHIYGIGATSRYTDTLNDITSGSLAARVLADLQEEYDGSNFTSDPGKAADLKVVGALALYDTEFILGLDTMSDLVRSARTIRQLHVMRHQALEIVNTVGCHGFPFALEENVRSLTPASYPTNFEYPSPAPLLAHFIHNVGDVRLDQAREGYVYRWFYGTGSNSFTWLKWDPTSPNSPGNLVSSLVWPGDDWIPGRGFHDYDDFTDETLHINDRVAINTTSDVWSTGGTRAKLEEHAELGRSLRVITYREGDNDGAAVRIRGFAIMKVIGYYFDAATPTDSWIMMEFVRWETSCGQIVGN